MTLDTNPFEYEAANRLSISTLLEFYIEDYNYSRFIRSRRNIFLVGERGTGKTMTLRYNSLPVQLRRAELAKEQTDLTFIAVYIPCNTPLTHRREYELIDPLSAMLISEHFLIVSIMNAILTTMKTIPDLLIGDTGQLLIRWFNESMDWSLAEDIPPLDAIDANVHKLNRAAQELINKGPELIKSSSPLLSFAGAVLPLVSFLQRIPQLAETHFSLMFDDAQHLNPYQIRCLNSWVSFRDNSSFSFKIATVKVDSPTLETSSGGSILEGHDFTMVDLEQPYQNKFSDFYKLADKIVRRRLIKVGISSSPEDFFPESPDFANDIKLAEAETLLEAGKKYPDGTDKQLADHVYKYSRARYFRNRSSKSNLPPYSGFDLLVHLSTGVIRNLLDPCFWIYDKLLSELDSTSNAIPTVANPAIQSDVIIERSKKKWEWLRRQLSVSVEGCTQEDAVRVYRLFDHLAILFKKRLLAPISEPRAVTFTVSEGLPESLERTLLIARKAQLLYVYASSAKDSGKKETYYVPNRILWPSRGLDPHGQHARVSIKARLLIRATELNEEIPFNAEEESSDIFSAAL